MNWDISEIREEIIKLIESNPYVTEWIKNNHAGILNVTKVMSQAESERLQFAEKVKSGKLSDFLGNISEMGVLAIYADAISILNSQHASKPRPRKGNTHKSLFIAAMKKFIKDEQTLDNFLANAKGGRVQGLRLKPDKTQYGSERLQRYILSADDAPKREKKITYKTLQTWWTEAKKESAPK